MHLADATKRQAGRECESERGQASYRSEQTGDYDYTNLPVAAIVMFINSDFEPLPTVQSARKLSPLHWAKPTPQTN